MPDRRTKRRHRTKKEEELHELIDGRSLKTHEEEAKRVSFERDDWKWLSGLSRSRSRERAASRSQQRGREIAYVPPR